MTQWGDTPLFTGVCHTLEDDSPAATEVRKAFGDNLTFPSLLETTLAHLPAAQEIA